jgi:hypothetical protein
MKMPNVTANKADY